jgi:serine protease Do
VSSRSSRKAASAALLVVLAFLSSCASLPADASDKVQPAQSYAKLKLDQLRDLEKSDPALALEAIASLLGEGGYRASGEIAAGDLEPIAVAACSAIEKDYFDHKEKRDFTAAIAALDSIKAIASMPRLAAMLTTKASLEIVDYKARRAELLAGEAEGFFAKGQTAPALALYCAALGYGRMSEGSFTDEALQSWAGRALAARDRRALGLVSAEMKSRKLPVSAEAQGFLSSIDPMATMRKGVVTIRIDRGIKIEQGYGVPDRVLGTAFYIDPAGYALTNYHVVQSEVDPAYEGYSRMSIKPSDSPEDRIGAKVIGYDRLLDIALIKIDAKPDYVFSFADAAGAVAGQKIFAIGSPAGLENTVTSGIVSAIGRRILQSGDATQVDAALNPGNSGGPLLDEGGRVLGVVFAGIPQFQGLNFTISSAWIFRVLPALFEGGEVRRAWLGLALAEKESGPKRPGLEITYRHPASSSGIEEGSRLLGIDGEAIETIQAAQAILLDRRPGSLATALVASEAGGEGRPLLRYLGERPFSPMESAVRLDSKERLFPALFGMSLIPLPGGLLSSGNYTVEKVWPGSAADESGLSENDPINLKRFFVDKAQRAAVIQIYVKKRKAGFLESIIQIPAEIDIPDFV